MERDELSAQKKLFFFRRASHQNSMLAFLSLISDVESHSAERVRWKNEKIKHPLRNICLRHRASNKQQRCIDPIRQASNGIIAPLITPSSCGFPPVNTKFISSYKTSACLVVHHPSKVDVFALFHVCSP